MKRIVTLQSISRVGDCSITMALPAIVTMGVECGILPTAALSAHTTFSSFTYRDLSDQIALIVDAWEWGSIGFDGIYTDYLVSKSQCEQVYESLDRSSTPDNLILVDPAMAGNGKLYPVFDESFPAAMAAVCGRADIIVLNLMEATLLAGASYRTEYNQDYIRELLEKLPALRRRTAVLTGVSYGSGQLDAEYLNKNGEHFSYFTRYRPQSYRGTGGLYSSVMIGGLMWGLGPGDVLSLMADLVVACIEYTAPSDSRRRYAAESEPLIGWLYQMFIERAAKQDMG